MRDTVDRSAASISNHFLEPFGLTSHGGNDLKNSGPDHDPACAGTREREAISASLFAHTHMNVEKIQWRNLLFGKPLSRQQRDGTGHHRRV